MPRVLMINTVCSGSHGSIMMDLGRMAAGAGLDPVVAFARGEAPSVASVRIGGKAEAPAVGDGDD